MSVSFHVSGSSWAGRTICIILGVYDAFPIIILVHNLLDPFPVSYILHRSNNSYYK